MNRRDSYWGAVCAFLLGWAILASQGAPSVSSVPQAPSMGFVR